MTTQGPPLPGPTEPEEPSGDRYGTRGSGFSPDGGWPIPPPPPWPGHYVLSGPNPGQRPRNGLGTAALVCGIIAAAMSFFPWIYSFTWPLGVLAVVFGAVGWNRGNKGQATNKPQAIGGLVLGIASPVVFFLVLVLISVFT